MLIMSEVKRYSWIGKDMVEEEKLFESHGFKVKKPTTPEPEIKIGYSQRIDVLADNLKAYLDPAQASLAIPENITDNDKKLQNLVFERYKHGTVSINHLIYSAVLVGAVAIVLLGLRR